MFKETVTYEDFNGDTQTDILYFNLSKSEMMEMEASFEGGYGKYLEEVVKTDDRTSIMKAFLDLIKKSYGVKSEDGKRFIKNLGITEEFEQSLAFEAFFNKLLEGDETYINSFVTGIMPKDLVANMSANQLMAG